MESDNEMLKLIVNTHIAIQRLEEKVESLEIQVSDLKDENESLRYKIIDMGSNSYNPENNPDIPRFDNRCYSCKDLNCSKNCGCIDCNGIK